VITPPSLPLALPPTLPAQVGYSVCPRLLMFWAIMLLSNLFTASLAMPSSSACRTHTTATAVPARNGGRVGSVSVGSQWFVVFDLRLQIAGAPLQRCSPPECKNSWPGVHTSAPPATVPGVPAGLLLVNWPAHVCTRSQLAQESNDLLLPYHLRQTMSFHRCRTSSTWSSWAAPASSSAAPPCRGPGWLPTGPTHSVRSSPYVERLRSALLSAARRQCMCCSCGQCAAGAVLQSTEATTCRNHISGLADSLSSAAYFIRTLAINEMTSPDWNQDTAALVLHAK